MSSFANMKQNIGIQALETKKNTKLAQRETTK
jgi:hypothetical protein